MSKTGALNTGQLTNKLPKKKPPSLVLMFGGTFDPIHHGHLRTALELTQQLPVAWLHLIPCQQPVHRSPTQATAAERLAMLRLAAAGENKLLVDERELARTEPSWSVDTLASLRAEYGSQQPLALVVGWDAFCGLSSWSRYAEIFTLAHLLVVTRPGQMRPAPSAEARLLQERQTSQLEDLTSQPQGKIYCLKLPSSLEISATYIRQQLAAGESVRYLVPSKVLDYIHEHKLYQAY